MRTDVPDKILNTLDDMEARGNVALTWLTVLKEWFEAPGRLPAFGLWIARRAAGRKGKAKGLAGALLDETCALLGTVATHDCLFQKIDRAAAKRLHNQAREFHSEFQKQAWGPVRIIHCWPVLLVERGLALHTGLASHPSEGYKLAADWAQNYDSRYGNGLNGPSAGKLKELVRFMYTVEALEEG